MTNEQPFHSAERPLGHHEPMAASETPRDDHVNAHLVTLSPPHPAMSRSILRPSPTLSPRQAIALEALVAGKRKYEAAAAAGVGLRTITRWLQTPAFRAALNQEMIDAHCQAALHASRLTDLALHELERILRSDEHAAIKIQAARAALQHRPSFTPGPTDPELLALQDILPHLLQALLQNPQHLQQPLLPGAQTNQLPPS